MARPSDFVSELVPNEGGDNDLGNDDQPVLPGAGKPWGRLVTRNLDPTTKEKHPFLCAITIYNYLLLILAT